MLINFKFFNMVESPQKPKTIVLLIRHGERIDKTMLDRFKYDWVSNDPIVTPDGCKDAFKKGNRILTEYIPEFEKLIGGKFD
jgi:6-phosphogluconate dehydrogenase